MASVEIANLTLIEAGWVNESINLGARDGARILYAKGLCGRLVHQNNLIVGI